MTFYIKRLNYPKLRCLFIPKVSKMCVRNALVTSVWQDREHPFRMLSLNLYGAYRLSSSKEKSDQVEAKG